MSTAKLKNTIDRISGSILSGKMLNPLNNLSCPCSICNKNCLKNQKAIQCDKCDKWCHIRCDGTSDEEYSFYQTTNDKPDIKWFCLYCTIKTNHQNFPFTLCDKSDLFKINSSDTMDFCKNLPSLEIIHETSSFYKYSLPDVDELDAPTLLTSKYHSAQDFQNLKVEKNFNIFHANVNGLEGKFDTLHNFLATAKSAMDVIAITETSEHIDQSFITNVNLDGYYPPFSTPSLSKKGGTALYVSNIYNVLERNDLKVQNPDFEGVWAEIKNDSNKNVVCGCVYRHPRQNPEEFFQYLDLTLSKISKENKEIYICGDFNMNLLNSDSNTHCSNFYNLLNSSGFLPLILHPSRVVEGQNPSLIDNIFSNSTSNVILSGNIYFQLSEHFSQFASIQHDKIDVKNVDMYARNYAHYSDEQFRDLVSIQVWHHTNVNDVNFLAGDFVWKLDSCAESVAPVEKLKPKQVKLRLKPWISYDLQKLIKVRDNLFARKKRQPENLHVRQTYNKARNRVTRELKKSKVDYHKKNFESLTMSIKKTWDAIRKIVNVKKSTHFSISQLNINGKITDNPVEITNKINNYFVNVGPQTEKGVPKVPNMTPDKFLRNRNQFNLLITHISDEEV